ncbi:CHAT domain-containing protein [Streptomyces sp. NPDC003036]|uniref:CHAT domain-containing protein n=1 Tax=Streptomyces sp. NPDC003036 TaxID=3154442 RepID=UPI0033A61205
MATELPVRIVQNPSRHFTRVQDLVVQGPDVIVGFDLCGEDRIRARLYGRGVPALKGTEHKADLAAKPGEVRAAAARLARLWQELFVGFRPGTGDGRPAPGRPELPYAVLTDLSGEPEDELHAAVEELACAGSDLLHHTLLGGTGRQVELFREFLVHTLADDGLRIRFDSDLFIPWPMLSLLPSDLEDQRDEDRRDGLPGLFDRFLGYRHQIEQTGGSYPWLGHRPEPPHLPVVSLNHDTGIDRRAATRAAEVASLLARGTTFVERTTRRELVAALSDPDLSDQLMYFWCHGSFLPNGAEAPYLAVRLSDSSTIDAQLVRERRRSFGDGTPFQPFVLLNACHAGVPEGDVDRAFLGRALIEHGARGVLGPQIAMPQPFAAEYALAFLPRYLGGGETAGEIVHALARRFADEFRNPLGFAYALHCGMDARLERAHISAAGQDQEVAV